MRFAQLPSLQLLRRVCIHVNFAGDGTTKKKEGGPNTKKDLPLKPPGATGNTMCSTDDDVLSRPARGWLKLSISPYLLLSAATASEATESKLSATPRPASTASEPKRRLHSAFYLVVSMHFYSYINNCD